LAYAIDCGTTTRPTVMPAMRSPISHCRLYERIHLVKGKKESR
jgi:hypothetical protein